MQTTEIIKQLRKRGQDQRRHSCGRLAPAVIIVGRDVYCRMRNLCGYAYTTGLAALAGDDGVRLQLDGIKIVCSTDVPDYYFEVFSALPT